MWFHNLRKSSPGETESIADAIEFILNKENASILAHTQKKLHQCFVSCFENSYKNICLGTNGTFFIPGRTRKFNKKNLWRKYDASIRPNGITKLKEKTVIMFKVRHECFEFTEIVTAATSGDRKQLTCLSANRLECGERNFENFEKLVHNY